MCSACDEFDTEVAIHGPEQLKRIIGKVRNAVLDEKLTYNSFESGRALRGQPPFMEMEPEKELPDVLRYYFDCPECGNVFGLSVETYHGQGGRWSRL